MNSVRFAIPPLWRLPTNKQISFCRLPTTNITSPIPSRFAVHKHHDHEEHHFFPEFNKRIQIPPKMSDDHVGLVKLLDAVSAASSVGSQKQTIFFFFANLFYDIPLDQVRAKVAELRTTSTPEAEKAALEQGRDAMKALQDHMLPHLKVWIARK